MDTLVKSVEVLYSQNSITDNVINYSDLKTFEVIKNEIDVFRFS